METVKQENGTAPEMQEERTFTQSELNAIIRDRVERANSKYADYEELKQKAEQFDAAQEAQKSELQKATERAEALQAQLGALTKAAGVREVREKVATEMGVPAGLLTADSEDDCRTQAQGILDFAKPNKYPAVKDGGELTHKPGGSTRDQFAEFFYGLEKKGN